SRFNVETSCTMKPFLRIKKCADTVTSRIFSNHGCASKSNWFWKNCTTASPSKQLGGRLILCSTSRLISSEGRALKLGEGAMCTLGLADSQPCSLRLTLL